MAQKGVCDWDKKLVICRRILGCYTNGDIVDLVIHDDLELASKVRDLIRKWRTHRPTSGRTKMFFDRLAQILECDPNITGAMLVDCTAENFASYLPKESRKLAQSVLAEYDEVPGGTILDNSLAIADMVVEELVEPPSAATPASEHYLPILVRKRGDIESIKKGIQDGHINQRHYYLSPEAANNWRSLILADDYPTYDHCKSALRSLFEGSKSSASGVFADIGSVAMLTGGGAPTKDLLIIKNLKQAIADGQSSIKFTVLDTSVYMLLLSCRWLHEALEGATGRNVDLQFIHEDVMDLHDWRKRIRGEGPLLMAITGGTIGNLSENSFFKSIESISSDGDLLIISAEVCDEGESEEQYADLVNKYDNKHVRRLLGPALRAVISELEHPISLEEAFKLVKVEINPRRWPNMSDIDGSTSVAISVKLKDKDIKLLVSTRYRSGSLEDRARKFRWNLLERVESPNNKNFCQFLFRREA